jgi:hypothetical protein
MKIKVPFLYEITYEDVIKENDRDGVYDRKVEKTERFSDWAKVRSFAYDLKGKNILQVVEVKDMTTALQNDMSVQGKD